MDLYPLARAIPARPPINVEAKLLLVNRAYCLLRVSGVPVDETWELIKPLLAPARAESSAEAWQWFMDDLTHSTAWAARPQPRPRPAPAPSRSSIGYPDRDTRRR